MRIFTSRFLCILTALAAAFTSGALRSAPLTKGPYLQAPGKETMTICWETQVEDTGSVRYGCAAAADVTLGPIKPTRVTDPKQVYYVYEAVLTGLKPGTRYHYEVQCGAERSGERPFTTFDPAGREVTFILYGDTRSGPERHQKLAEQFPALNPAFILHSGDLVGRGSRYELWAKELFVPLAHVLDRIPMLPSLGNHEDDGLNYAAYFHLPEPERFYSFDAGPVHVLVLDYTRKLATDEQFRFAQEDLARSRAPWKIVLLHHPMFNLGGHATFWGHDVYLPLFRQHRVDIVAAGHSHLYERFRPLVPRADPQAWAIQHITTGGGGAPLSKPVADPALASHAAVFHYLLMHATPDTMTARTIDIDGKEIDRFALHKTDGRQDPAWLAQACAEEDVIAARKKLWEALKKK
ncbi:MAG: metallophosphoesterase family protein [Opitutae bacterium]|nr:metallophosphoesterase family protein [Opitutae bacterium]